VIRSLPARRVPEHDAEENKNGPLASTVQPSPILPSPDCGERGGKKASKKLLAVAVTFKEGTSGRRKREKVNWATYELAWKIVTFVRRVLDSNSV